MFEPKSSMTFYWEGKKEEKKRKKKKKKKEKKKLRFWKKKKEIYFQRLYNIYKSNKFKQWGSELSYHEKTRFF